MKYEVDYELDGKIETQTFRGCRDAGMAFAKCQKDNPGAKMLHCIASSGTGIFIGKTEYEPPPVQRDPVKAPLPPSALKPDEEECRMPFYDETLSAKPFAWPPP